MSQYGSPVAVKFSPAGIERLSMSQVETISLDQNTVPLRCAPRYAARARIMTLPAIAKIPAEAFVHRRRVKQRIDVIKARSRADGEHVLRWIDIRLRLIQPDVIESVRFHVPVANLLPEPLRRLRVRRVEIRSDHCP